MLCRNAVASRLTPCVRACCCSSLVSAARVLALMDGRYAASVADVRRIAPSALRHRVLRTFEAEADAVEADDLVEGILQRVPVDPEQPESSIVSETVAGGAR